MSQSNYQNGNNIMFKKNNIENAFLLNQEQDIFFHVGLKSHLNLLTNQEPHCKCTKPA